MAFQTDTYTFDDDTARRRWGAFWERSPLRSPFTHFAFVEASAAAFGFQAACVFVADEEGDVAAALVPWKPRGPWRDPFVPAYTAYSAVLLRHLPTDADAHYERTPLTPLLQTLATTYPGATLHLPPSLSDVRPAQWHGWAATPLYTYRATLPAEGLISKDWRGNARRRFNKEQAGFAVTETEDPAPVVAQVQASLQRQQRQLPCRAATLETLFAALQQAGLLRLFVAEQSGTTVGGMAVLVDRAEGFNWLVGSDPGPAMTVLMGEALTRLRDAGVRAYDWVGANTAAIAEFKRSFGGTLTPYYRLTHPPPRPLRWLRAVRARLR